MMEHGSVNIDAIAHAFFINEAHMSRERKALVNFFLTVAIIHSCGRNKGGKTANQKFRIESSFFFIWISRQSDVVCWRL